MTASHPTLKRTYSERASDPSTGPLASYLLRLISIKKTNLCLSADVETSAELLALAEQVGDSICVLKTHCDIITDWTDRTAKSLRDLAQRKHFVIFEDRKFADIGGTVQKQYTSGHYKIAQWAEITNAHILPGPAIVTALKAAADATVTKYNTTVHTEISASPRLSAHSGDEDVANVPEHALESLAEGEDRKLGMPAEKDRKCSIVSVSTTISTRTESISPRPSSGEHTADAFDTQASLTRLGEPPFLRSLLLLAEMSSEGALLTGEYTEKCIEIARQNRDFVMGFIAQRSLNSEEEDNFITMTPGVQLPHPGEEGKKLGDGLGQQYNSPHNIVFEKGCDIIIVGRGIVNAKDRLEEAERYRQEGWKAYISRIGKKA
ncbi:Orotidine 5'-phosphate decarboxylase [Delitschia confertaspora ATCC 74209]|uniref:Orotidine 5'-phosphate decarboxylase n=1 Tax=Delitschia confertaspora ATCC 74209 TaxID=1513339 RepID=A0A9P4JEE4_9PLEO|nr:Orotidine 5'-phosphate decarboxylase [Delitschia confertaspora ATCC 74209]